MDAKISLGGRDEADRRGGNPWTFGVCRLAGAARRSAIHIERNEARAGGARGCKPATPGLSASKQTSRHALL